MATNFLEKVVIKQNDGDTMKKWEEKKAVWIVDEKEGYVAGFITQHKGSLLKVVLEDKTV